MRHSHACAHGTCIRRSMSVSFTYARASERARRRRCDDDPAVRWRRMDGWTKAMRAVYPSVHPSFDRSFDGWVPPVSLASIARRASSTKPAVRDASIDSARARARGSTGAARLTRSPPIDPRSLFRFHSTREKCPLLSPLAFPRAP